MKITIEFTPNDKKEFIELAKFATRTLDIPDTDDIVTGDSPKELSMEWGRVIYTPEKLEIRLRQNLISDTCAVLKFLITKIQPIVDQFPTMKAFSMDMIFDVKQVGTKYAEKWFKKGGYNEYKSKSI